MKTSEKYGFLIPEPDDIYDIDYVSHNVKQIEKLLSADETQDSVTVISEDGNSITTTYADGTSTLVTFDETSIIEAEYDATGNMISKRGTYIDGNTIEEKEMMISE